DLAAPVPPSPSTGGIPRSREPVGRRADPHRAGAVVVGPPPALSAGGDLLAREVPVAAEVGREEPAQAGQVKTARATVCRLPADGQTARRRQRRRRVVRATADHL